jgi:5S rRNA maturation endonuclease (ribonuclease M5)
MKISFEEILLNATLNRRGDHFICDCPFCGKQGHLYFNKIKALKRDEFGKYLNCWDCKKCGESGNLTKYLKEVGLLSLLQGESIKHSLNKIKLIKNDETVNLSELDVPDKKLPVGFYRIFKSRYLKSRGFVSDDFKKYKVGRTDNVFKFEKYLIFSIEEEHKCKGYIARSFLSKEKIKEINEEYKNRGLKKKYLRWINSENTDFSKLLGGIDEISFGTETAILVEGLFDKKSVDSVLKLDFDYTVKCCFTFGKSISEYQIAKLIRKNVKNLVIVQDPDAVKDSKKVAFRFSSYFDNIKIGYTGNKDLGDSNEKEVLSVFANLKNKLEFNAGFVLKRELS